MSKKAVIYREGVRYWMSKARLPDGRRIFKFWSSEPWPFHHGWTFESDKRKAYRHFLEWIPK